MQFARKYCLLLDAIKQEGNKRDVPHLFGIFHDITHVSRISADEKHFGSRGHFHLEHEHLCNGLAAQLSEILHT